MTPPETLADKLPAIPSRAMVLAAGRGRRMRELTDRLPKPLVEVRGRALIDHVLDRLAEVGVGQAVVNHWYRGEQIERHLNGRAAPAISFSPEQEALDTGGGVRRALGQLGETPFFVINGDVVWLDGRVPALQRLARSWDERRMEILLLLHPTAYAVGYEGPGDFMMAAEGGLRRRGEREVAPFVFSGVQLLHPRVFEGCSDRVFSLNRLYDRAIERERLWGLRHDGEWFHIGTPEALQVAEQTLHHMSFLTVQR